MITKKTFNNKSALAYCLKLTGKGTKLSARWDGGFDALCIQLHLDNRLFIDGKRSQMLSQYIAKHIQHRITEDGFQPPGYLDFDRENAHFVGRDMYSQEAEKQGFFEFKVQIPSDLWFDEVLIEIQSVYAATPTIDFQFSLQNGPVLPDTYTAIQNELAEQLEPKVEEFMDGDEEILVLHERLWVGRHEFVDRHGMLTYHLTQLKYSYEKVTETDIVIDLKAK